MYAKLSRAVRHVLTNDCVLSDAAAPDTERAALRLRHRSAAFDALLNLDVRAPEHKAEVSFEPHRGARALREEVRNRERVHRGVAQLLLGLPYEAVLYKFRRAVRALDRAPRYVAVPVRGVEQVIKMIVQYIRKSREMLSSSRASSSSSSV